MSKVDKDRIILFIKDTLYFIERVLHCSNTKKEETEIYWIATLATFCGPVWTWMACCLGMLYDSCEGIRHRGSPLSPTWKEWVGTA